MKTINIVPENSKSVNYAFDVTPSKYISKLITEKGVVDANEISIKGLKNKWKVYGIIKSPYNMLVSIKRKILVKI